MKAFKITETGTFMTKLLSGRTFDTFLLEEASLNMQVGWVLDGKINRSFFTEVEWADESNHPYPLIAWGDVRGNMRELIRGKKAPASLSIVLHLRPDRMEQMLDAEGYPGLKDSIGAMVLNIRYDGSEVTLVTGIALSSFTLDRNADRIWDESMGRFLSSCDIKYETLT